MKAKVRDIPGLRPNTIIGTIERYTTPSYRHLLVHLMVAVILSLVVYIFLGSKATVSSNIYISLVGSLAASSGALIAISMGLGTFFSRHVIDWRDKLFDDLKKNQAELEAQMEKSANKYPEISERLTELYLKSCFYSLGQPIDAEEIFEASRIFDDWARDKSLESQKSNRTFNLGDLSTYESFEKHIFDASLRCERLRSNLILLSVAEVQSRAIGVFPPLITTWAVTFVLSIIFLVLSSANVLNMQLYLPTVLMPLYLALIGLIALVIASRNILIYATRGLEIGNDLAMTQLASRNTSDKNKT